MQRTSIERGPLIAEEDERTALKDLSSLLADGEGSAVRVTGEGQHGAPIPESARLLFQAVLSSLVRGEAVEIVSYQPEITIFQAASLLGMPTGTLDRLLDDGAMPFRQIDLVRLIAFRDVMAYRARQDNERSDALDELVRLTEEYGLNESELAGVASRRSLAS